MKIYFLFLIVTLLGTQEIEAFPKQSDFVPDCSQCEDGETRPNINSCSKYYLCVGGKAIPQRCAYGLYYDATSGLCNRPFLVDCVINRFGHNVPDMEFNLDMGNDYEDRPKVEVTTSAPPCTTKRTTKTCTTTTCTTTTCTTTTSKTTCSTTTTCSPIKTKPTTSPTTTCAPITPKTTSAPTTPTTTCKITKPRTTSCTTTTCTTTKCTTTPCITTKSSTTKCISITTKCPTTTCTTTKFPNITTKCTTTTCTTTKCPTITTKCTTTTCTTTTCTTTVAGPNDNNNNNNTNNTNNTNKRSLPYRQSSRDCNSLPDRQYLLDYNHCRRYYVCFNRRTTRIHCDAGQWFDQDTLTCRPRSLVTNCRAGKN